MSSHANLTRTLGLPAVVLFGLAYMTPMVVFGTFGVLSVVTSSAVPSAYVIALAAMMFTALSYGQMARRYPIAGSAYTYTSQTFGPEIGFLVGWAAMLDYMFLPMVIWLIGAAYLSDAFPLVPSWFWLAAYILLSSAINIIGLKMAKRVNLFLMAFQLIIIIAFSALAIVYLHTNGLLEMNRDALTLPFLGNSSSVSMMAAGAAIASYSFLGFDAVSTLAEETHEPGKTIPRAILLVTLLGGGIFIAGSYILQLAFPGNTLENPDSAAYAMSGVIGGKVFMGVFLFGIILAQFASGIAAQASGSRLLYVMGREGVFPKSIFGRLHERFRTPYVAIIFTGGLGFIALKLDVATSTSFINFGAFLAFAFVNLSVIVHYYVKKIDRERDSPMKHIVMPAIGLVTVACLLFNLQSDARILGSAWLAVGAIYLALLTRFFTRKMPRLTYREDDIETAIGTT